MFKKYYKGALIGGLLGVVLFVLGLLNEMHGPIKEFAQIIGIDFRSFAFWPCLVTQCQGEECMICFLFFSPLITILSGALIGLLINIVIKKSNYN